MHLVSECVHVFISVSTVKECVDNLNQEDEKEKLVSSLWGAERCLRVLESVSTAQTLGKPEKQTRPGLCLSPDLGVYRSSGLGPTLYAILYE